MLKRFIATAAVVAILLPIAASASGNEQGQEGKDRRVRSTHDEVIDTPLEFHDLAVEGDQHGGTTGHIPGSQENVELVGRIDLPRTNNQPGRITDVWSKGQYAYLGTFAPPCSGLGVNIVDISDPTDPERANFIPSRPDTRVNDVKVFALDTPSFSGDLLLHSNEDCGDNKNAIGGVSLYDVSDPLDPQFLANAGDFFDDDGNALDDARPVHNVYAWQEGSKAFAILVDDVEVGDVDVIDISDPRNPVQVAETGAADWPDTINGLGDNAFLHDVWVKNVDGLWTAYLSYWDSGLVLLDVSDPANPQFLGDSDYPDPDPLTGFSPPEGNSHAAVPDRTGEFILMGDEDFSPYRSSFEITTGDNEGEYPAGEFGWTVPIAEEYVDGTLNGPTVYGGLGCDGQESEIPSPDVLTPQAGEEKILVLQRGDCFFSTKVENGQDAGYDAVIIPNHHAGSGFGDSPDAMVCGSQGHDFDEQINALCTGHRTFHVLFDTEPAYTDDSTSEPQPGDLGEEVKATSQFDGWGYLHLLDAQSLEEIDAFAPPELLSRVFATGFGDLTMHNVETDPADDLAYISWYSLGLRILRFDDNGLEEVGHYIDAGGNNFWGVHYADDAPGGPVILASDRDTGLWIFRYTGD